MRLFLLALAVLAFPALALPAHADPYPQEGICDSGLQPALHRIEITGGSASTTVYVDDENYALGNGLWVYEETNGVWVPKMPGVYQEGLSNANLQRGGGDVFVPEDNEICVDVVDAGPDQIVF